MTQLELDVYTCPMREVGTGGLFSPTTSTLVTGPAEVVLVDAQYMESDVAELARPVVVRSAHGELVGIAKVESSTRRGAVSVPHGHQGANVNLLTSKDEIDPLTGMARYSGLPVSVHPAPAAAVPTGT